jgi:hypothetical protein
MLSVTILQENSVDRSEKSDVSTLSNTGANCTPDKSPYTEIYKFTLPECDDLTIEQFINHASKMTSTQMEMADFKQ